MLARRAIRSMEVLGELASASAAAALVRHGPPSGSELGALRATPARAFSAAARMTTLRKLPTRSPSTRSSAMGQPRTNRTRAARDAPRGFRQCHLAVSRNDRAELEDRQVHRDDHAADQHAEDGHDERLEQGGHAVDRVVDLRLVEVGDLADIASSAPASSPTAIICTDHVGEQPVFSIAAAAAGRSRPRRESSSRPFCRRCCPWPRRPTRAPRPAARRPRTWSTACARNARSPTCAGSGR